MRLRSIDPKTGMPILNPKLDSIGLDVQTVEDVVISHEVIPRPLGDLPPKGTSVIVEPLDILTENPNTNTNTTPTSSSVVTSTSNTSSLPNLGAFLGSLTGGSMGGGAVAGGTEDEVEKQNKKPFPYWLIAVALVGGYLIFRKK